MKNKFINKDKTGHFFDLNQKERHSLQVHDGDHTRGFELLRINLTMKKSFLTITLTTIIALSLFGCSTWRKLDGSEKGAVIGEGSGAVVGDMIAPGVGGTLLGAGVGAVGGALIGDDQDKHHHH